jgi:hypothetical protein
MKYMKLSASGKNALLLAVLAFLVTSLVSPQTARQGTREEIEGNRLPTEFSSPMILELPLDYLITMKEDGAAYWEIRQFSRFHCMDVSIPKLRLRKLRKGTDSDLQFGLEIETHVATRRSGDRDVDLILELLKENTLIAHAAIRDIDAEEGRVKIVRTKLSFAEDIFANPPTPRLAVKVIVADNAW